MRRFEVKVHGHGLDADPEYFGVAPQGFYATRVVSARNETDAVAIAIAEILADEDLLTIQSRGARPPKIDVEAVRELSLWHGRMRRPKGFSFYAVNAGPESDSSAD